MSTIVDTFAGMLSRRDVLAQLSMLAVLGRTANAAEQASRDKPVRKVGKPLVGIQIAPHNMLDEGVERCLDLLQETAGIDAMFPLSHAYYVARNRAPAVLAPDHGITVRDERTRKLPKLWIRHHEKYFANTTLRHYTNRPDEEYCDQDIFSTLREPLRKRGMKLYARLYEPSRDGGALNWIRNWEAVQTVDIFGQPGRGPCWNHPDYRAWIAATMKDMFINYDLDGLQYGAERVGPLSEVLYRGIVPACFCKHCLARNRDKGIDPQRARQGYQQLYELIRAAEKEAPLPADGLLTTVLRTLFDYSETIAWNTQWFAAEAEIQDIIYKTVKSVRPNADVGWHVDHQRSTWDTIYRAVASYEGMARRGDFIKPILYHEIMGPRMRDWVIAEWHKRIFKELASEQILAMFYAIHGYDPKSEPSFDALANTGFSTDYVYRETKRCVEGAAGRAAVYCGVGLDIPWNDRCFASKPQSVYEATTKAFDAGADGIVISREYDEMRVPNLQAVGRAVRQVRSSVS